MWSDWHSCTEWVLRRSLPESWGFHLRQNDPPERLLVGPCLPWQCVPLQFHLATPGVSVVWVRSNIAPSNLSNICHNCWPRPPRYQSFLLHCPSSDGTVVYTSEQHHWAQELNFASPPPWDPNCWDTYPDLCHNQNHPVFVLISSSFFLLVAMPRVWADVDTLRLPISYWTWCGYRIVCMELFWDFWNDVANLVVATLDSCTAYI